MPDSALSQSDYRTLAAFRFALRRFLSFSESSVRALGLTPRQHQALLGIKAASAAGAASMTELAAFLILHHNSAVELVNRLETTGLAVRTRSRQDRRQVQVQLTEAGESRLADLSAVHMAEIERIRRELRTLLDRMDHIERHQQDIAL